MNQPPSSRSFARCVNICPRSSWWTTAPRTQPALPLLAQALKCCVMSNREAKEQPSKLDGAGQHSPNDIPAFLRCAERTNAVLVVGNRMTDPRGMPWLRRQVNRWMSRRLSKLAGRPLPDTQCGFRLMKLEPWSRLSLRTTHFEIESEALLE